MINIIMLALTCACLVFGFLFGLIRGFKRSLGRLIILFCCLVAAWFLRLVIADVIMNIDFGGQTLAEMLGEAFEDIPIQSLKDNLPVFVKLIIGLITYILIFLILQFLTQIILGPIVGHFVHRGGLRVVGMLVGLVQGAMVAFFLCVPIAGLVNSLDSVLTMADNLSASAPIETVYDGDDMDTITVDSYSVVTSYASSPDDGGSSGSSSSSNNELSELNKTLGLKDFKESFLGKIYIEGGKPIFRAMTTTKEGDTEVSLFSILELANVVADKLPTLIEKVEVLTNNTEDLTNQIANGDVTAITDVLDSLGEIQDSLSAEDKKQISVMLKDVINEMAGDDVDMPEIPDDLFETADFAGASEAIKVMGDYSKSDETLTTENANKILTGIGSNAAVLDFVEGAAEGESLDLSGAIKTEEDRDTLKAALDSNTTISAEDKAKLEAWFKLN